METKEAKQIRSDNVLRTGQRNLWLIILLALTIFLIVIIYFFNDEQPRFSVLKINGVERVSNLSKPYYLTDFLLPGKNSRTKQISLLVEEGDIVSVGNFFFPYHIGEDSISLFMADDGSRIYKDGKLVGFNLFKTKNTIQWLSGLPNDSLQHLEMVGIDDVVTNEGFAFFKRLASIRKDVALNMYERSDSTQCRKDFAEITRLFTPKILLQGMMCDDMQSLSNLKKLETLVLVIDNRSYHALPSLPHLKQCIIIPQDTPHLPNDLFVNTAAVQKLTFASIDNENLKDSMLFLKHLSSLRELTLSENYAPDINYIQSLAPDLTVLNLSSNNSNLSAIAGFKKLQWLGLPADMKQKTFDDVIPKLDKLQVLELYGNDSVTNFSPLLRLKDLKAFVILDTITDKQALSRLRQLRYLSLPKKTFEDSNYIQSLEKALPGTIIVPNSGVCLGSGWLLLLVPIVAAIIVYKLIINKRDVNG
jgi:hypothetical protein